MKLSVFRTIEHALPAGDTSGDDVGEVEIEFFLKGGLDGIGPYEFHGAPGFDRGSPSIKDVTFCSEGLSVEQIAAAEEFIGKGDWDERFPEFAENAIATPED